MMMPSPEMMEAEAEMRVPEIEMKRRTSKSGGF
jgi:hypothetical protein